MEIYTDFGGKFDLYSPQITRIRRVLKRAARKRPAECTNLKAVVQSASNYYFKEGTEYGSKPENQNQVEGL